MLSIKIGHDPRSCLTSLYLNKQFVDRLGGPGGRCTLTLLHPTQNGSILFFCNSLFGTKLVLRGIGRSMVGGFGKLRTRYRRALLNFVA